MATNTWTELFGTDTLLSHSGTPVAVNTFSSKSGVMIYFSAHWCPPCRGFTPELAKYYKEKAEKFNFEIVFVSSDSDQKSFDEYWAEMPWLALPYEKRNLKDTLSKKYKVNGIPTLVVLDSQGKTVTTNGRSKVTSEPDGYPWTPKTFFELFSGDAINGKGEKVSLDSLKSKTAVGIYFSAHWCGPCRGFTPKLIETYKKIVADGKEFEIVFCTSDRDEAAFQSYFGEMPWLALPFKDPRIKQLSEFYDVEGIPTFVVVDPKTGKTISAEGRGAVSADPEGKEFPWFPKPLNDVEEAGSALNEAVCFVYMDSKFDDELKSAYFSVADSYFQQWNKEGKDEHPIRFYYSKQGDLYERIRQFFSVTEDPVILIFNLPAGEKFTIKGKGSAGVFRETAEKFLKNQLTPEKVK